MTVLLTTTNKEDIIKTALCAATLQADLFYAYNLSTCHMFVFTREFDIIIFDRKVITSGSFCVRAHVRDFGYTCPVLVYNEQKDEELQTLWIEQNKDCGFETYINSFACALSQPAEKLLTDNEGKSLSLRPQTRNLLSFFFKNHDKPVSIQHISDFLWGKSDENRKDTIYSYIYELRRCLQPYEEKLIITKKHNGDYILQTRCLYNTL